MCKDVFVDEYKQSVIIKNQKNFLYKIKKLKFYIVEFDENGAMKSKVYPADCAIRGDN